MRELTFPSTSKENSNNARACNNSQKTLKDNVGDTFPEDGLTENSNCFKDGTQRFGEPISGKKEKKKLTFIIIT